MSAGRRRGRGHVTAAAAAILASMLAVHWRRRLFVMSFVCLQNVVDQPSPEDGWFLRSRTKLVFGEIQNAIPSSEKKRIYAEPFLM